MPHLRLCCFELDVLRRRPGAAPLSLLRRACLAVSGSMLLTSGYLLP